MVWRKKSEGHQKKPESMPPAKWQSLQLPEGEGEPLSAKKRRSGRHKPTDYANGELHRGSVLGRIKSFSRTKEEGGQSWEVESSRPSKIIVGGGDAPSRKREAGKTPTTGEANCGELNSTTNLACASKGRNDWTSTRSLRKGRKLR